MSLPRLLGRAEGELSLSLTHAPCRPLPVSSSSGYPRRRFTGRGALHTVPRTLEDSRGCRHPCPYMLGSVGVTARKEACGFSSCPGQEPLSQQHSSWLCFLSVPISPQAPFTSPSLLPTEARPSSQIVQQPGRPEAFLPSPWCPGRRHRALPDPSHQACHRQWGRLHAAQGGPACTMDNAGCKMCHENPAGGRKNAFSHSPYDSVPAKVPRGRGAFKKLHRGTIHSWPWMQAPSIPGLDGHPRPPPLPSRPHWR